MLTAGQNNVVTMHLYVTDVDGWSPLIGLVSADFTKALVKDTALSIQPLVVTEIGSGHYYAQFTPNGIGTWYATIITPVQDVFQEEIQVGEYDALTTLAILRKTSINRLEVNLTTQMLVLYDDDGTTIKQEWPLETNVGPPTDPVTTQPGVQTKRKPPLLPP
jgi:hypothetical protein